MLLREYCGRKLEVVFEGVVGRWFGEVRDCGSKLESVNMRWFV